MKKLLAFVLLAPFLLGIVVTVVESTGSTWDSETTWSSDPGGSETPALQPDPLPPPSGPIYDLVLEDLGFVRISEGSFPVGSPDTEPGHADGERRRLTTVTDDFFIQPTEMTVSQVERWLRGNMPRTVSTQPATGMTWDQTQQICEALNEYFPDYEFRLPTENEWEYAGRAMSPLPWAVPEEDQPDLATAIIKADAGDDDFLTRFVSRYAHYDADGVLDVASLRPNHWGLFDMQGNVWEWCADDLGDGRRVIRGGAWSATHRNGCRIAVRGEEYGDVRKESIGFRVIAIPR